MKVSHATSDTSQLFSPLTLAFTTVLALSKPIVTDVRARLPPESAWGPSPDWSGDQTTRACF